MNVVKNTWVINNSNIATAIITIQYLSKAQKKVRHFIFNQIKEYQIFTTIHNKIKSFFKVHHEVLFQMKLYLNQCLKQIIVKNLKKEMVFVINRVQRNKGFRIFV